MDGGQSKGRVGPYRLIRSLGQGGMAEVFLALGPRAEHVAVKRLAPSSGIDGAAMMSREGKLAGRLAHPNIVRTLGFSEHDNYIVMEYVPGRTVEDVVERAATRGGLLPLDAALSIVHAVAQGLHAAHEARDECGQPLGIVHRDVTPSNILVAVDGTPKLSDFGIAKATGRPDVTYGGPLKGKTGYMSPEQCRSDPVDRRSDVFSLGAILFELTIGRQIVKGPTALATMVLTAGGEYPRPRDVQRDYPGPLDAIVAKATAFDPRQRYRSAREFWLDLDAFAHYYGLELSPRVILHGLSDLYEHDDEDSTEVYRDTDSGLRRLELPPMLPRPPASAWSSPIPVQIEQSEAIAQ